MKIEFPFPDMKRLSAHAKGNWRAKSTPTKEARTLAKYICMDLINRREVFPIAGPVLVSYALFVPDNRPRDAANMIQACKPLVDGVVDSGLVEGDSWQVMKIYNVSVEVDKANPRVELVVNSTLGVGDLLAR